MPFRPARRPSRPIGPRPFSTEWHTSPPPPPPAVGRVVGQGAWSGAAPAWLPSGRLVSAVLVLLLAGVTALGRGGGSPDAASLPAVGGVRGGAAPGPASPAPGQAAGLVVPPAVQAPTLVPTATTAPPPTATALPPTVPAGPTATVAPLNLKPAGAATTLTANGLLPQYRILSFYGQPHDDSMGILGEFGVNDDLTGLRDKLKQQAAEYEQADPSRPVLLAFEVIASVAQGNPGSDGSWLAYTDDKTIQEYVDFTKANNMLLILDYQFGRTTIQDQLNAAKKWLVYPHVHLALDPEFKMAEGETPGVDIGQIDAADITYAQHFLVQLCAEKGLPPKVLIVHQFHYVMIQHKEQLAPVAGVQLVLDMDGHGPPDMKRTTYAVMNTEQPVEFNGVKLFYKFDKPLLSASDVLHLQPVPDVVIYQ